VVYHKTPVTLKQATGQKVAAKVPIAGQGATRFEYLLEEKGVYYGMAKKSGEWNKTLLTEDSVEQVFVKNKPVSTWVTIGVIALPAVFLIILIAEAAGAANLANNL
jgi:hypothetical protein